ncbi:hypothetical protein ABB37_01058 [Leptomonas pyrrhocoris]|uniref:Protein kinase domain-containing protein n=1 Tax=Leptomonas pyrrhocoris TaxID=157538 RepID=A0A0M9G825_LEPPY|nr:hypothetical protein ABB37_01058 [Leptomonas pyrrhocoris]KPA84513.1 hypothetical protein ABB37_01058 [Leptomonas pyrrhocoris]|eukprot:XP_015662952.1 hypothetical protein ABB37_01058 [Leptomonas pyrrhocoris]
MASRFRQLLVSDSEEDSADRAVIAPRDDRSNGVPSAHATPPPTDISSQPARAVPPAKPAESGVASVRTGTPRNGSVASSKPVVLESSSHAGSRAAAHRSGSTDATSIDFDVDQTPNRGADRAASAAVALSSSQHSLTFDVHSNSATPSVGGGLAPAVPVPRRTGGGFVRQTPENTSPRGATAPQEATPSFIDLINDSLPQQGVASVDQGTPLESSVASSGSGTQKKRTKVVRRKVVTRRRRHGDPSDPGEVMREDGQAIPPGRQNGSSRGADSIQPHLPPPPSRVSPRALRAAASRSASRANSPAEGPRTPGGGLRVVPPQIPTSRANSRAATPRTPRVGNVVDVPPLSARSQPAGATAAEPLIPPRANRHSSRHATPRTPAERAASADSPIAFETTPDTATSNTIYFHVDDANARTDDTISFAVDDDATAPRRTASRGAAYPHRHPQIPSPSALVDSPTSMTTDENGEQVMRHRAKVQLTKTADGHQAWVLFSPRLGESTAAALQEIPAPPKRLSQRAQDILAAKRRAVESDAKKRHAEAIKRTAASESPKSPVFLQEEDEGTSRSAAAAAESELHFESAPLSEIKPRAQRRGPKHRPAAATRSSKRLSIARRTRVHLTFPPTACYSEAAAQQHAKEALAANDAAWTRHPYDALQSCAGVMRASGAASSSLDTEKVVRTLQPVQVAPTVGTTGTCRCVVYDRDQDDALRQLISDSSTHEEGVRRYLNLQPMQLANVEMQNIVDPPLESPAESGNVSEAHQRVTGDQRGMATLGGLWCTAEALRDDGRPATRKDGPPSRRILRICGGQALGVPLQPESGTTLDVRCYELLLFPRESLSPSAVNYGSEGLTLGQLIAPPASSLPLTPRIVDDLVALKEYKKRLLSTKNRQITIVNNEDDRDTFADAVAADTGKVGGGQYLTLTMVTISSRQKYTIELTLVLLPFRSNGIYGGKTVAEVPRFCPTTVMTYRRLQGVALSFSTKSAFMSAYKALLWATECDIVDVQNGEGEDAASAGLGYSKLRVCATSSPMVPWVSSFGHAAADKPREETYHGNCLDFAVLTLAAPPEAIQKTEPEPRDPLTLEDFVMDDADDDGDDAGDNGPRSEPSGATGRQPRRSSIFTNTLVPAKKTTDDADDEEGANAANADTVVGLTPYGAIRRAVNQTTSEVFDVRVMPRNRGRMAPTWDAAADVVWNEAGGQAVKAKQEQLLQQDVEAAIMMEYASRLPFHSRVYGVLVDEQRYYIFQEPWISALALEQSVTGSPERDAVEYNAKLKSMTESTAVMSLKDFMHAILRPDDRARGMKEEVRLQLAHVLAAQLLLLITSLHGKGMLLGPCPPQRLLVRVQNADQDAEKEEEQESVADTPDDTKKQKRAAPKVPSSNIQLFVPDLGVNTLAWGYERQQCGVLEYLPPLYVLEQMLSESIGKKERSWTMHDDWWTYLTLCFELFAGDGTALVTPKTSPPVPTPAPTLTKFFSPVDILDVWQEVVANSSGGVAGTAAETVGMRVRRYVHQRVLRSISRSLDSWILTKAEELEYFGTTAARRGHRVVRAVPPPSGSQGRTIGVSLAAVYMQSARETSETTSVAFQTEDGEGGEGAPENVLEDMPWVFQVRDFFDAILDAVFARSFCSVHGPALRLVSHPFFRCVSLPHIFDGTFVFSATVSQFAARQLTKSKVQTALLAYRTRAYRGPMAMRPEVPLMITGSAYNAPGGSNGGAPLLMLSSPANQEEQATREQSDNFDQHGAATEPMEGLVFSRKNSLSQGLNGVTSPRSQSPAAATWSQQKLRAMYNPVEWQSIAALETEVRGALSAYGPHESVSGHRASANRDHASQPVTINNRSMQSAGADTPSVTSSGRRRDPREYEEVVDSRPHVRPARRASSRDSRGNGVSSLPAEAYDLSGVPSAAPQETYSSHSTYSRDGYQPTSGEAAERDGGQRRHRDPQQPRHARRYSHASEIEKSLNELAAHHARMRQNGESPRHHHRERGGGGARGYETGHPELPGQQQKPQDSRPSSRHSSRHHEGSGHHAWPGQFLDAATLQKKGQPQRLADSQNVTADRLTPGTPMQRSQRDVGANSHQGSDNVRALHESSSEESYVLVPSDGEVGMEHGHGSAHPPSGMSRESPVPRNPRGSHTGEGASARESYLAF